jgi:transcription elongation factor Elf1
MGERTKNIVPLYSARLSDLVHAETITATCPSCGHSAEVPVETIWKLLPQWFKILDLGGKLKCSACGSRPVEVHTRAALGYE